MSKIEILKKLKEIHLEYKISDNLRRIRLFDASEFLFNGLKKYGVEESWGWTYVCYGDAFTMHEYGMTMDQILRAVDK